MDDLCGPALGFLRRYYVVVVFDGRLAALEGHARTKKHLVEFPLQRAHILLPASHTAHFSTQYATNFPRPRFQAPGSKFNAFSPHPWSLLAMVGYAAT